MAYFVSKCGGLRVNTSNFTEIDGVITSGTQSTDVFTPTYSTGVTAKFNATQYQSKAGKQTLTFTASVVDTDVSWEDDDGTAVNIADFGFTEIVGTVDGSTITVTYTQGSEPRTELVGDPFTASMCGGLKFDDGVFAQVNDVITTVGTSTVSTSFKANCSLLFDSSKFKLGSDEEIALL